MAESIKEIIPLKGINQGNETFKIKFANGAERILETWDYATIYSYPKLYNRLYCDLLAYRAYQELSDLLLKHASKTHKELTVLDVACGSGLMGKALKDNAEVKIKYLLGIDILPEAIEALNRDYPEVYDDALVVEGALENDKLTKTSFDCITICGGANHIGLSDLQGYVDFLNENAYMVFNLLLNENDHRRKTILGWLDKEMQLCESKVYDHRKLMNGKIVRHEAFLYAK